MLEIAYIAKLAHWLSVKRRTSDATHELRKRTSELAFQIRRRYLQRGEGGLVIHSQDPQVASHLNAASEITSSAASRLSSSPEDTTRCSTTTTSLFRAAAEVCLECVIASPNDPRTGLDVAIHEGMSILKSIPPSDADRNLVWPITIIGSMARNEFDKRDYIADRFPDSGTVIK